MFLDEKFPTQRTFPYKSKFSLPPCHDSTAALHGMYYRSLIYPALMSGGKKTPLNMFLVAALFCLYNGFLQASYLLVVASYPDTWLTSATFLSGKVVR